MIDEQTVSEMLLASEMIGFEKGRDAGRKAGLEEAAKIVESHKKHVWKNETEKWGRRIIAEAIRRRASEIGE